MWSYCIKKVFLKFSQNSQESTCTGVSFFIKVSDWRLETRNFFKYTPAPAKQLLTATNQVRNIERLTDAVHKKLVYSKTSIQQEMFGEKMFCGKCSCRVIEQVIKILGKHLINFNKIAGI